MFLQEYECNNENDSDETAILDLAWTLTPVDDPAQEYFFQIATDSNFNSVDHGLLCMLDGHDICGLYEGNQGRVIGPTNHFGSASVEHPETLRYARVKVKRSYTSCPSGGEWVWSNTVIFAEDCLITGPGGGGGPPPRPLDKFFCNSGGQPTNNPQTGKLFSAIGCIPVDRLQAFTRFTLTWGMGLGGGISFLLSVYAGFLYMTSAGNPQKVQAARQLATAAVGGLFYLLFAVFMFRLIGSNILNIPGL